MSDDRNQEQIIRKDARNCFVESKSDSFDRNRIHFFFATYDTTKPEGARYINTVNIYIPAEEFLELCRKLGSGSSNISSMKKRRTTMRAIFTKHLAARARTSSSSLIRRDQTE